MDVDPEEYARKFQTSQVRADQFMHATENGLAAMRLNASRPRGASRRFTPAAPVSNAPAQGPSRRARTNWGASLLSQMKRVLTGEQRIPPRPGPVIGATHTFEPLLDAIGYTGDRSGLVASSHESSEQRAPPRSVGMGSRLPEASGPDLSHEQQWRAEGRRASEPDGTVVPDAPRGKPHSRPSRAPFASPAEQQAGGERRAPAAAPRPEADGGGDDDSRSTGGGSVRVHSLADGGGADDDAAWLTRWRRGSDRAAAGPPLRGDSSGRPARDEQRAADPRVLRHRRGLGAGASARGLGSVSELGDEAEAGGGGDREPTDVELPDEPLSPRRRGFDDEEERGSRRSLDPRVRGAAAASSHHRHSSGGGGQDGRPAPPSRERGGATQASWESGRHSSSGGGSGARPHHSSLSRAAAESRPSPLAASRRPELLDSQAPPRDSTRWGVGERNAYADDDRSDAEDRGTAGYRERAGRRGEDAGLRRDSFVEGRRGADPLPSLRPPRFRDGDGGGSGRSRAARDDMMDGGGEQDGLVELDDDAEADRRDRPRDTPTARARAMRSGGRDSLHAPQRSSVAGSVRVGPRGRSGHGFEEDGRGGDEDNGRGALRRGGRLSPAMDSSHQQRQRLSGTASESSAAAAAAAADAAAAAAPTSRTDVAAARLLESVEEMSERLADVRRRLDERLRGLELRLSATEASGDGLKQWATTYEAELRDKEEAQLALRKATVERILRAEVEKKAKAYDARVTEVERKVLALGQQSLREVLTRLATAALGFGWNGLMVIVATVAIPLYQTGAGTAQWCCLGCRGCLVSVCGGGTRSARSTQRCLCAALARGCCSGCSAADASHGPGGAPGEDEGADADRRFDGEADDPSDVAAAATASDHRAEPRGPPASAAFRAHARGPVGAALDSDTFRPPTAPSVRITSRRPQGPLLQASTVAASKQQQQQQQQRLQRPLKAAPPLPVPLLAPGFATSSLPPRVASQLMGERRRGGPPAEALRMQTEGGRSGRPAFAEDSWSAAGGQQDRSRDDEAPRARASSEN